MGKVFKFTQEELEGDSGDIDDVLKGKVTTIPTSPIIIGGQPLPETKPEEPVEPEKPEEPAEIEKPENYNSLFDKLSSVDSKYSTEYNEPKYNPPESLNLQKLEYTGPSEDDIYEAAKNSLIEKQITAMQKIANTEQSGKASVQSKIDKLLKETQAQAKALENNSSESKKNAQSNAVKRGLARSSIVSEHLNEIEKGHNETSAELEQYRSNSLNEMQDQLKQLEADKEAALQDYEMVYAAGLQTKIDSLMAKMQSEIDSINKYNNTVDEKETKYAASIEEAYRKAQEDERKRANEQIKMRALYGDSYVDKQILEEKLEITLDYFKSLEPKVALELFRADESLKGHLKDYYGYVESLLKARIPR